MAFRLNCDTCEFATTIEEEQEAYDSARKHEGDHPAHFVYIHTVVQGTE